MKKIGIKPKKLPEGFSWVRRYSDIKGWITEIVCPHEIGHDKGIHGCDGCCAKLIDDLQ